MLNRRHWSTAFLSITLAIALLVFPAGAADVPARLPGPSGRPGDAAKPVKVYILAGQSNMVGMGEVSGAKNRYAGVYFSSDSAVPKSPVSIYPVGTYQIAPLAVYQADGTPRDQPIAEGLIEVPENGVYQLHCGYHSSSYNRMMLDGEQVYIRAAGGAPVLRDVTLQSGQPRGGHIYNDFRGEFKRGSVTIAAISFLRYSHPRIKPYPPRGHLTVWMEEQVIPPLPVTVAK